MSTFQIVHDEKVKPFVASFPGKQFSQNTPRKILPSYVQLKVGNRSRVFKPIERKGADGSEIHVNPHCRLPNNQECALEPGDPNSYRVQRLLYDPELNLALCGFFVASAGLVTDAALDIGKTNPIFVLGATSFLVVKVMGYVLKITGFLMVLITAIIKTEP